MNSANDLTCPPHILTFKNDLPPKPSLSTPLTCDSSPPLPPRARQATPLQESARGRDKRTRRGTKLRAISPAAILGTARSSTRRCVTAPCPSRRFRAIARRRCAYVPDPRLRTVTHIFRARPSHNVIRSTRRIRCCTTHERRTTPAPSRSSSACAGSSRRTRLTRAAVRPLIW